MARDAQRRSETPRDAQTRPEAPRDTQSYQKSYSVSMLVSASKYEKIRDIDIAFCKRLVVLCATQRIYTERNLNVLTRAHTSEINPRFPFSVKIGFENGDSSREVPPNPENNPENI